MTESCKSITKKYVPILCHLRGLHNLLSVLDNIGSTMKGLGSQIACNRCVGNRNSAYHFWQGNS